MKSVFKVLLMAVAYLAIPVSILAMRLAENALKKQANNDYSSEFL